MWSQYISINKDKLTLCLLKYLLWKMDFKFTHSYTRACIYENRPHHEDVNPKHLRQILAV